MKALSISSLFLLVSCFSSGDFFHDKVGMGKNKSHFEDYLEVKLVNHVDSIGRGGEMQDCTLKENCKFYYGTGTPGNSFDNQGLNVKTDANDVVQDISWWYKINMNYISLQLENIRTFPTALERFGDDRPDYIFEAAKGALPVKQFQFRWKKKWGVTTASAFCYGKEHENVRNCHVINYWISYKPQKDYWEKTEALYQKEKDQTKAQW